MIRRYLYIALVFSAAVLSAQDRGVKVHPGQEEVIAALPGQIITSSFIVTNNTREPIELTPVLNLPGGWQSLLEESPFELAPGAVETRLISCFIPGKTTTGTYPLTYRVEGRELPSISDEISLQVRIEALRKLTIQLLAAEDVTIAGRQTECLLQVGNESNLAGRVVVSADCRSAKVVSVDPENILLEPGESRQVRVLLDTDAGQKYAVKVPVQFRAEMAADPSVSASTGHLFDIIPRVTRKEDGYHRLPAELSLRGVTYSGEKSRGALQGEISADGFLDQGERHKLLFNLRGPDIYGVSIYAQRERLFAGYEQDNGHVYGGDRPYTLSFLTERARYGRGAEAAVSLKGWTLGGYALTSLWRKDAVHQRAAYLSYAFSERARVQGNYLDKRGGDGEGSIVSVEGDLEFLRNNRLHGEFASADAGGGNQEAVNLELQGELGPADYLFTLITAGREFPGYYRDTRFFSANAGVTLLKNLRIAGNMRRDRQNYAMDTTRFSAPLSYYSQFGCTYGIGDHLTFGVDQIQSLREDRMPQPRFYYKETYTRVTAGLYYTKFSLQLRGEFGTTRNFLTGSRNASQTFTGSLNYRPARDIRISGFVNYFRDARYADGPEQRVIAGTSLAMKFTTGTSLMFTYRNNFSPENYFMDRNLFELKVRQQLFGTHAFSLKARQTLLRYQDNRKDVAVIAEYTVPMGIPLSRKQDRGGISGYVLDGMTGRPVADVVVMINGVSAVTNRRGLYRFPALKPGEYYLNVDRQQLGMYRITAEVLPRQIAIEAEKQQRFDIHVMPTSRLSGSILQYEFTETTDLNGIYDVENMNNNTPSEKPVEEEEKEELKFEPVRGLPGVVVDLERGEERHRRISDRAGYFYIDDIRPGTWTLRIYPYNIPAYHQIEHQVCEIVLEPGEEHHTLVRVLPRRRKLQIIEDGGTIEVRQPLPSASQPDKGAPR
ncbi:carboxypeptidase regulatory-like domain-containing protein [bacterium]|nr:carboxypeptidase regulatory-like domain-containing protein [bacterium]